ncbi:uncharacterized transmembrane protein DDB_G0289901-like [Triticum urartu]|uniref:Uncharacterized protein n=1 Tax=Triticum urartu TaxID=4572 RepID=A0A8R7QVU5_TRIUA|nr:uncharacterized transmembrane protein DDB_G0289901-like [Triticum urartu]
MAAASSLRNALFPLLRKRIAMARRMSTTGTGTGAGITGGGSGTGGAANSGGARTTGSGGAATGGGGAATGGASNSGGRMAGGGSAGNSGGSGGATGVDRLRKDIFKETRRLWEGYNVLSEVDRNLFGEIARLEMDNAMNRVNAKVDLVSTTYKFLGSTAVFIIAFASCLGPYIKDSVVHDAAKEVDERMTLRKQQGEGVGKTATPGDAAPTTKVHTQPDAAAAPTGGSASAAPGAPATVEVKNRAAPAPEDVKKKGAATPGAGSASVNN